MRLDDYCKILLYSWIVNIAIINTYYKEFFEQYAYIGKIWEQVEEDEHKTTHADNNSHDQHDQKEKSVSIEKLTFLLLSL